MFVLGTAGHVDHGKSSFLRSLSAMEPDRLPEEKKRGMTIDLNFVWFGSEKFGRIGIVDVPGHRRFVKNMISGTMNVDAFLFVVAADDGWMPQSEEHLQVLKSLGVRDGVVVLTKIDLVSETRSAEVEGELDQIFVRAFGRKIPIVRFSAPAADATLPPAKAEIERLLNRLAPPRDIGRPRLWVDRVFLPKGLGTVVTGTLRDGVLQEGDTVTLWPSGQEATVKTLQSYQLPTKVAQPAARVAIQLSRVAAAEVSRGFLVEKGPPWKIPRTFDCRLHFFSPPKRKDLEVAVHAGTAHAVGLAVALGDPFYRLKLKFPMPLRSGEKFILRTVGEERTIGSGTVIDPRVLRSTHRQARLWLDDWSDGAAGWVAFTVAKQGIASLAELSLYSIYPVSEIEAVLRTTDRYRELDKNVFVGKATWDRWRHAARGAIAKKKLTEREFFKALKVPAELGRVLLPFLRGVGDIDVEGGKVLAPAGSRAADPKESAFRDLLLRRFSTEPGQPVGFREVSQDPLSKRYLSEMSKDGTIVALGEDHYLTGADYTRWREAIVEYLTSKEQATTAELRATTGLSRKNLVLILERLDRDRVTYLKDGVRRLLR